MKPFLTILIILLCLCCLASAVGVMVLKTKDNTTETTDTMDGTADDTTEGTPESSPTDTTTDENGTTDMTITTAQETTAAVTVEQLVLPELNAAHVFVYDVASEQYLFEKATDQPIVPASISKLLVSLCALHYMPKDYVIQPQAEELAMVKPDSSIAYIKKHHKLTLEMLVEAMMLPSGNDAAHAVAAGVARYVKNDPNMDGEEAVEYFLELVNAYAVSIGCTGTQYVTPDGYAHTNHYNSVHDLVIIAKLAIANEVISKYTATPSDYVTYASGHTNTWKNTNKLLHSDSPYYSPYVTGLKTGSLNENYCLLISAEIGGKSFIIGVFKAPEEDDRYEDALEILSALEAYVNA